MNEFGKVILNSSCDCQGNTPLHWACIYKNRSAIWTLSLYQVDHEIKNTNNHYAIEYGLMSEDFTSFLISNLFELDCVKSFNHKSMNVVWRYLLKVAKLSNLKKFKNIISALKNLKYDYYFFG